VPTSGTERGGFGRRAGSALVALAAVLATLLIVEAVLRTTHAFGARVSWTEPDPGIGFRSTPGRAYWNWSENDHPVSGRINSHGWRDRERSAEKPRGVYRVAFLGDSFVEAMQVETDSTFLALAEDDLNSRSGRRVEIMNFGRSGATQTEELLILRSDVEEFSPDMVALFFNPGNDIGDVARETTGSLRPFFLLGPDGELRLDTSFNRSRAYRVRALINGLKQRSAVVSLLAERYNLLERGRRLRAAAAREAGFPTYLSLCTSAPDSMYVRNYRLNKILMREMARWSRERGLRFLLVCGSAAYREDEIARFSEMGPDFDPDWFEGDLAGFADSLGIDYLSLQKPFRRYVEERGGSLHWGHYNYAGHRVAGRALSEKLAGILSEDGPR
jgi:hypothetical protein